MDGDGREFKVTVQWPDGYIGCPRVVALVDRASSKAVGWAVGKSENADVTEAALIHMCETNYRPNRVVFDQGSAFNSQRIAGGQNPAYRTKQSKAPDWAIPGVLQILGIEHGNKGLAAKTSNLQENVWSNLRHVDNDPRFHGAQRTGPNDPENPQSNVIPLDVFEKVLADHINRLSFKTDNRVKGLKKGESRADAFERLLGDARQRVVTPFMRRRLNAVWKLKTVQPDGRIRFDGGMFGDHSTQIEMLRHVGKQLLIGFDPNDFNAPAMVCHWHDEAKRGVKMDFDLPAFRETAHGSTEGKRAADTEKSRVNTAVKKLRRSNPNADVDALRKALEDVQMPLDRPASDVVELHTGSGFSAASVGDNTPEKSALTDEMLRNFERDTERRLQSKY